MEDEKMASTEELAMMIGKSNRYVQLLAKQGIITTEKVKNKNKYNLFVVIKEIINYEIGKEETASSDLETAKIQAEVKLKDSKAKIAQLELKELEGRMHSAEDVEDMTTDLCLAVRSELLSMPGQLSVDLAEIGTAEEASERIKKAVNGILDDLTRYEYNPEEYRKRVRERQGWLEKIGQDDEGAE